jgi:hypothetical protein
MKRLVLLLTLLAIASPLLAQTTSVTLNVTDAGGQSWNNGSYTASLQPGAPNPSGLFYLNGVLMNAGQLTVSGTLSGSGSATFTLSTNSQITPSQSVWKTTICPQGSGVCYVTTFGLSTSSQTINAVPPAISVAPGSGVSVYNTNEIVGAVIGSQAYVIGTGPQFCTAVSGNNCTSWASAGGGGAALAGNNNAIYFSPSCPNPSGGNCFFVNANTKVYFGNQATIAINSSSPQVTCNVCNFTTADLSKPFRATNGCCNTSIPTTGISVIPANATISTITNTTTIQLSANATGSCTAACLIAYGNYDDAGLSAGETFASTSTADCFSYVIPIGIMLVKKGHFNSSNAACNSPFTDALAGNGLFGGGMSASLMIPSPGEFDFTTGSGNSCGGGTGNLTCFGAGLTHGRDWAIYGMFNSESNTVAHTNAILFGPCQAVLTGNCIFDSIGLFDWDAGDLAALGSDTIGLLLSGSFSHVQVEGFGDVSCRDIQSAFTTSLTDSACGNSLRQSLSASNGTAFPLTSKGNLFGQTGSTQATVYATAGSINSLHDTIFNNPGSFGNTLFYCHNSSVCKIDGMTANQGGQTGSFSGLGIDVSSTAYVTNSSFKGGTTNHGCVVLSTGILYLQNTICTGAGTASSINNAGTVYNQGGNTFSGGSGGAVNSGTVVATVTEAGTVTCAANAATITYKLVYQTAPVVTLSDETSAATANATAKSATTATVHCSGATDVVDFTVTPNVF